MIPVIFAAAAFGLALYRSATTSPFINDAGWLLGAAHRITLGQVPYRDFLMVQTPGTPAVLALGFLLLGKSWWTVRLLAATNAAATVGLTGAFARRLGLTQLEAATCCAIELVWAPTLMMPMYFYDSSVGLIALAAGCLLISARRKN